MNRINVVTALLALALPIGCCAQTMFRCKNAAGSMEYSDKPCERAASAELIQIRPNSLDSSEERRLNRRTERQQIREARTIAPTSTPHVIGRDPYLCNQWRGNLRTAESANVKGKASIEDARAKVVQYCGPDPQAPRVARSSEDDFEPPPPVPNMAVTSPNQPVFQRGGTGIYRPDGSPTGYWGPNNDYCNTAPNGLQCGKAGFVPVN